MTNPSTVYDTIKWWGPIIGFVGAAIKGYYSLKVGIAEEVTKSVSKVAEAVAEKIANKVTEEATRVADLAESTAEKVASKVAEVKAELETQSNKNQLIVQGVVSTLALLEDRTRHMGRQQGE